MAKITTIDERIAKVEGILEQMSLRLTQVEADLRRLFDVKADKWEIRIWFIILTAFMGVLASLSVTILSRL